MAYVGIGALHLSLTEPRGKPRTLVYDSKLEKEKEQLTSQLEEVKDAYQNLLTKFKKLETKLETETSASRKLGLEHEKTIVRVSSMADIDQIVKEEIERLKEQIKTLRIEKLEQKTEIDELLLRLSKIAGDKMVDGNASITNLGDKNRPQKLAEKFTNLYDNSWTDAYEIIGKNMTDENVCQQLLLIFQSCWTFCTAYAQEQLEDLIVTLLPSFQKDHQHDVYEDDNKIKEEEQIIQDIPNEQIKLIKDTRRCFAQQFIPTLFKLYRKQLPDNEISIVAKSVRPYVESCLELCWHSAISNPPLQFSFTVDNIDNFKGYIQNGSEVDYVVWPAMYLYECGPLLCKGVVQFKKQESHKE